MKFLVVALIAICTIAVYTTAETLQDGSLPEVEALPQDNASEHTRTKRTLFLKKKLAIGAGLLGFGIGVAKGLKLNKLSATAYSAPPPPPEVHHVYLAHPPTVRYVEYIEKPVIVRKIIEKPVYKHAEYEPPMSMWSQRLPEPSSVYGVN